MSYENAEFGESDFTFPHRIPSDTGRALRTLRNYPWMDSLTLDVALDGVRGTGVGQRNGTDLLVVSLSTTDAIGHAFGPSSMEQHDQLLRLDHWLGWFIDSLAVLVPGDRTVFALTADHGVQPFPEMTGKGGRLSLKPLADRFAQEYQARYRIPLSTTWDLGPDHRGRGGAAASGRERGQPRRGAGEGGSRRCRASRGCSRRDHSAAR